MSNTGENIYERRDGRWEGRYICGRKPDGRAQYVSVYGRSCSDVRNKIRERLRACTPEPAPRSTGASGVYAKFTWEKQISLPCVFCTVPCSGTGVSKNRKILSAAAFPFIAIWKKEPSRRSGRKNSAEIIMIKKHSANVTAPARYSSTLKMMPSAAPP